MYESYEAIRHSHPDSNWVNSVCLLINVQYCLFLLYMCDYISDIVLTALLLSVILNCTVIAWQVAPELF